MRDGNGGFENWSMFHKEFLEAYRKLDGSDAQIKWAASYKYLAWRHGTDVA